MAAYTDANQVRLGLKMKLSVHNWYTSSNVVAKEEGYAVVIHCKYINGNVRKNIPSKINGVSVKAELE